MHMTHSIKSSVFTKSRLHICNDEIPETTLSVLYVQLFKITLLLLLQKELQIKQGKMHCIYIGISLDQTS